MNELRGPLVLAVLSGLLLFAAFPPLDIGLLGWVALVPLLLAVRGKAAGSAALLGAVAGGVAFIPLLSWMRVFGVLAWLLVAGYLAAMVGVFALLYAWLADGRRPLLEVWAAPVVWTVLEYLRSIGVFGFPWAVLGVTQHAYPAMLQVAKYTGVFGVSFLLVLGASALASLLRSGRLLPALLPAVLIAAVVARGEVTQQRSVPGAVFTVAAVQPNIAPQVKFDPLLAPAHMQTLRGLIGQAGRRGAALIVLPETAIPFNLFGPQGALKEVGGWARGARATLIATSLEGGRANVAVAVAPSGQAIDRYDKVRLVAFGEYGLVPGRRHDPLRTPVGIVGVAVCFESIFPDVSRALARNGAEILAVVTNDGWFNGTGGRQHAAHSVLRAVETGRWVVRAANTGLTMIVDPRGRVRAEAPPQSVRLLVEPVSRVRLQTYYTEHGNIFAGSMVAVLLGLFALRLRGTAGRELSSTAFQVVAVTVGIPFVSVYLLLGSRAAGAWPALLLMYVILFTRLRPPAGWGLTSSRALPAAAWGTGVVLVLGGALALAFRAYDLPVGIPTPPEGWVWEAIGQLIVAAAAETWLRGIAFTSFSEWKGPGTAVIATAILGVMLHRGLGAEAMAWGLVTGVAFGLIRLTTGNALGLIIPHALGNILFSMIGVLR